MRDRLLSLADRAVIRALALAGTPEADRDVARDATVQWARNRARSLRRGTGVVMGLEAVVERPGQLHLRPVERALAAPGEVTVETLVSALSTGTERAQWLRLPHAQPAFPYRPGYSACGRVLAVGAGTRDFRPGDLVAVPRVPHTSVVTVANRWVHAVPEGVSPPAAALTYMAMISGYGVDRADLVPGGSVCVIGAGVIGALAQRLALGAGPRAVTVIARTRTREAAARAAGATDFRAADDDVSDLRADVVIEATGDPQALITAVRCVGDGGRVVVLGSPRGPTVGFPLEEAQGRGVTLVGAHISSLVTGSHNGDGDPFTRLARRFLDGLAQGSIVVDDLVGEPTDPRELARTYDRLARGDLAAAHLDWTAVAPTLRAARRRLVALPARPPRRVSVNLPVSAPAPMTSARMRMAVVGCGDIGLANARAVAAAGNAELQLCVDQEARLAEAAALVGGRAATSLDEAFDPGQVDAVVLCVPHDQHGPLAVRAAEAGLHVIVEKPLAVDYAGARRAADAAAAAGVALTTCFPYRYESHVVAARAAAAAGALGEVQGATVVFHADKAAAYWLGGFSGRSTSTWRLQRSRAGGGVFIMNVTHYLDLLRLVGGVEPERVTAFCRDGAADVEDGIAVAIALSGGGVATVVASATTPGAPSNRFEIWGSDGTIRLEPEPEVYTRRALAGITTGVWNQLPPPDDLDVRAVFVERFVTSVRAGTEPDVSVADSLAVQRLVEATYRSAREGRTVALVEIDGPAPAG